MTGRQAGSKRRPENTALHFAVEKGNREALEILIERGADISIPMTNGDSPLKFAVMNDDVLVVEYPKGMQSRLLPLEKKDTFLVEDIFEVIRLKKAASGKNGELLVLGHTK